MSKRKCTSLAAGELQRSKAIRPPVLLEEYVEQHKLFDLLKQKLPDAQELGITQEQYRALQREQLKFNFEEHFQKCTEDLEDEDVEEVEELIEEYSKQLIVIPKEHLDPRIKDFLMKTRTSRKMLSTQMRKVLTSERYKILKV